jgi:hypothetical protein
MNSLMNGSVRQLFHRSGDRKLLRGAEELQRVAGAVREGHLSERCRVEQAARPAGPKQVKRAEAAPAKPSKPNGQGALKAAKGGVNLALREKGDDLDKEFERY